MIGLMHNLVHWMPDPFVNAFSPDYVARVQSEVPVNTFRFRDFVFDFGDLRAAADLPVEPGLQDADPTN